MFKKSPDLRSAKAMNGFLLMHPQHEGAWAHNIRFSRLDIPSTLAEGVWDLEMEFVMDDLWEHVRRFEDRQQNRYTMVQAGRSGGWMHLHNASLQDLGHRSHCISCGAKSTRVIQVPKVAMPTSRAAEKILRLSLCAKASPPAPIDNRCQRCGGTGDAGLQNYPDAVQEVIPLAPVLRDGAQLLDLSLESMRSYCRLLIDFADTLDAMTADLVAILRERHGRAAA